MKKIFMLALILGVFFVASAFTSVVSVGVVENSNVRNNTRYLDDKAERSESPRSPHDIDSVDALGKRPRLGFVENSPELDREIKALAEKLKGFSDIENKYHDGHLFSYREERNYMGILFRKCYSLIETDYLSSMQELKRSVFDEYCMCCRIMFFACLQKKLYNYSKCVLQTLKGISARIECAPWEIIDDDHYDGHEDAADKFLKYCKANLNKIIKKLESSLNDKI